MPFFKSKEKNTAKDQLKERMEILKYINKYKKDIESEHNTILTKFIALDAKVDEMISGDSKKEKIDEIKRELSFTLSNILEERKVFFAKHHNLKKIEDQIKQIDDLRKILGRQKLSKAKDANKRSLNINALDLAEYITDTEEKIKECFINILKRAGISGVSLDDQRRKETMPGERDRGNAFPEADGKADGKADDSESMKFLQSETKITLPKHVKSDTETAYEDVFQPNPEFKLNKLFVEKDEVYLKFLRERKITEANLKEEGFDYAKLDGDYSKYLSELSHSKESSQELYSEIPYSIEQDKPKPPPRIKKEESRHKEEIPKPIEPTYSEPKKPYKKDHETKLESFKEAIKEFDQELTKENAVEKYTAVLNAYEDLNKTKEKGGPGATAEQQKKVEELKQKALKALSTEVTPIAQGEAKTVFSDKAQAELLKFRNTIKEIENRIDAGFDLNEIFIFEIPILDKLKEFYNRLEKHEDKEGKSLGGNRIETAKFQKDYEEIMEKANAHQDGIKEVEELHLHLPPPPPFLLDDATTELGTQNVGQKTGKESFA